MTGKIITLQELINAQIDANALERIINEAPWVSVETRLGRKCYSISTVQALIDKLSIDVDSSIIDLQNAIDIAAAAGAGENGWTDLLIATETGLTQRELNKNSVFDYAGFNSLLSFSNRIVHVAKTELSGTFILDLDDNETVADGGVNIRDSGNRLWRRINFDVIKPTMFGATNDIAVDSTEFIRSAHNIANRLNLPVSYSGLSTVAIQSDARIIVNTSVDFSGCDIHVLNGITDTPYWDDSVRQMFIIRDVERIIRNISLNSSELVEGATKLTVPDNVTDGFLLINSDKQIGNRVGYSGRLYFKQPLSINRGGILIYPLSEDLTTYNVTATYYAERKNKWIEITGLNADISTFNNQCLLKIERNYVRLSKFALNASSNEMIKSINYMIWTNHVTHFVFEDSVVVAPESIDNTSTYGLVLNYTSHVTLRNLTGQGKNSWGFQGSIFVSGLTAEKCDFGRMDCHEGLFNWTIKSSSIRRSGLRYGWGGGYLEMSDIDVFDNTPTLVARADYDNHFNGSISLRKIRIHLKNIMPSGASAPYLPRHIYECAALGTQTVKQGTSDVIAVKWADSILIEDVEYHHNLNADLVVARPFSHDVLDGAIVHMPQSITVRNIKPVGNRLLFSFSGNFEKMFPYTNNGYKSTRYLFENIESGVNQNTYMFMRKPYFSGTVADWSKPFYASYSINNCKGLTISLSIPNVRFTIRDSEISAIRCHHGSATNQQFYIYNSIVNNTAIIQGTEIKGQLCYGASRMYLYNTLIEDDCELNNVKMCIGTVALNTVALTFSQGTVLTMAQMLSGYRSGDHL